MDIQARISEIEKEIRETPYHKGTEHHIGLLRARLARLQDQVLERKSASRRSGGGGGFAIRKAGDATVVLVGPPSVGKSTLLNALTNARSPVAPYAFTTVTVIPGMMSYQGALIQIMDVPGIIEGASHGRGRGKEVLSVIREADLIILLTELGKEKLLDKMQEELFAAGVRLNQSRPQIHIEKRSRGGIQIRGAKQSISHKTLQAIFHEFGFRNVEITLKESVILEILLDALSPSRVFITALFVVNKVETSLHNISLYGVEPIYYISAKNGNGLLGLKEAMWDKLRLVRVYLAKPGVKPDYDSPIIMRQEDTIKNVVEKLDLRGVGGTHARISGPGSKFTRQQVSLSTPVVDEMVVTFE